MPLAAEALTSLAIYSAPRQSMLCDMHTSSTLEIFGSWNCVYWSQHKAGCRFDTRSSGAEGSALFFEAQCQSNLPCFVLHLDSYCRAAAGDAFLCWGARFCHKRFQLSLLYPKQLVLPQSCGPPFADEPGHDKDRQGENRRFTKLEGIFGSVCRICFGWTLSKFGSGSRLWREDAWARRCLVAPSSQGEHPLSDWPSCRLLHLCRLFGEKLQKLKTHLQAIWSLWQVIFLKPKRALRLDSATSSCSQELRGWSLCGHPSFSLKLSLKQATPGPAPIGLSYTVLSLLWCFCNLLSATLWWGSCKPAALLPRHHLHCCRDSLPHGIAQLWVSFSSGCHNLFPP